MKYFEDIQVGDVYELGRYTFTANNIKAFAARFDPQPSEVSELRLSNSRPDRGLMTFRSIGVNQNGEPVISFVSTTFVERRRGTP